MPVIHNNNRLSPLIEPIADILVFPPVIKRERWAQQRAAGCSLQISKYDTLNAGETQGWILSETWKHKLGETEGVRRPNFISTNCSLCWCLGHHWTLYIFRCEAAKNKCRSAAELVVASTEKMAAFLNKHLTFCFLKPKAIPFCCCLL